MKEDHRQTTIHKRQTVALLAHVDAGKTTLSEAMLYSAGALRRLGRVDHGDSFLDDEALERERGITIFSKQARLSWGGTEMTLLDTPGHVDFSAETERALKVPDCAVLIISAADGVRSHTETLWKLLARYRIPAFLFINKMDLSVRGKDGVFERLEKDLGAGLVDMTAEGEDLTDALTLASETLTERLLTNGSLTDEDIAEAVRRREIFPCYFGAALKNEGVEALMDGLERFGGGMTETEAAKKAEQPFGAKVFKIGRDRNGERLTFVRITSGTVTVKQEIGSFGKVDQIRLYSGARFTQTEEAGPGTVCALTGLTDTRPGLGLGQETSQEEEVLEPFLSYRAILPDGKDPRRVYEDLSLLAEEDPKLQVALDRESGDITVRLMGQVQMEVLSRLALDRFGYEVTFGAGTIVYRETIANTVEGVGHFEPLRHYAEVHLILEPGEPGSGIILDTCVSEDDLYRNWQRLILSHLMERELRGVLINAPLTDIHITLAAGRAHKKHTEGGDFRQATFRALRQGLMKADSVLLEPLFSYRLEVPADMVGKAMTDLQNMGAVMEGPEQNEETAVLTGTAPAAKMKDYPMEVVSYTGGRGRLSMQLMGYGPCANAEEVIKESGYDPTRDMDDPVDSVFVSHTGSDIVPWDKVEEHMHLPLTLKEGPADDGVPASPKSRSTGSRSDSMTDDDLSAFEKVYGPIRRDPLTDPAHNNRERERLKELRRRADRIKDAPTGPMHLVIDGYNLLHAGEEWKELLKDKEGVAVARERLLDILANYAGFTGHKVTLVFDAYRRPGASGTSEEIHGVEVVYTHEDETADAYIERLVYEAGKKERIRVITSDALIQTLTLSHGALRTSSREFLTELEETREAILDTLNE